MSFDVNAYVQMSGHTVLFGCTGQTVAPGTTTYPHLPITAIANGPRIASSPGAMKIQVGSPVILKNGSQVQIGPPVWGANVASGAQYSGQSIPWVKYYLECGAYSGSASRSGGSNFYRPPETIAFSVTGGGRLGLDAGDADGNRAAGCAAAAAA